MSGLSYLPRLSGQAWALLCGWSLCLLCMSACAEPREQPAVAPVFTQDLAPLLEERCGSCHGEEVAEGGYSVASYLDAIGCAAQEPTRSVVEPRAPRALLLWTLRNDEAHQGLLSDAELADLTDWVVAGAPQNAGGVHGGDILHPFAAGFHGQLATADRFAALTDATNTWACGRCHDGAPVGDGGRKHSAPGATACTNCHRDEDGVLACNTCHGAAGRSYPPRDPCLSGDDAQAREIGDAHSAHFTSPLLSHLRLECRSCHPSVTELLSDRHGNGKVDVELASPRPGSFDRYDSASGACTVYCHDAEGQKASPAWRAEANALNCGGCHDAPPAAHYTGPCNLCHLEVNERGDRLTGHTLHLNGTVDPGDGVGLTCAGCHRDAEKSAWPNTPSHQAHKNTLLTEELPCATCHVEPRTVAADGHLDKEARDAADVQLADDVAVPGKQANYDAGSCHNIRCHGGDAGFRWDMSTATTCDSCHGAPPPAPHPAETGCSQLTCHGAEVGLDDSGAPRITEEGRIMHMDGRVQAANVASDP